MNPQLDPQRSGAVSTPTLQMRRLRVREAGGQTAHCHARSGGAGLQALVYVS